MTLSRGALVAGGLAAGASVAVPAQPARAAQFSWKFGNEFTIDHPVNVRAIQAFAKIREDTNGQLEIKSFPNSSLGSDPQMLAQLRSGALEMLAYAGGILDTVVPLASIESIAFAFPNNQTAFAAMDGDLGTLIRKQIIERGMMALDRNWENGFREFTTNTVPIRSVEDLQGLKLRVSPGKLRFDSFHSLGASVTPIPPNELYAALQTHVVDGQETSLLFIETQHFFEVQKYCSLTHHMWSGHWNLINIDKWNSLPPAFQRILRTRLDEAVLLQRHDNAILNLSIQDKLSRQGLAFNKAAAASFKAKLVAGGYYTRWRAEFGEEAWRKFEKYTGPLA